MIPAIFEESNNESIENPDVTVCRVRTGLRCSAGAGRAKLCGTVSEPLSPVEGQFARGAFARLGTGAFELDPQRPVAADRRRCHQPDAREQSRYRCESSD